MPHPETPRVADARLVPAFLGSFFVSGRVARNRPVEIGEGLWPLLSWCWSLAGNRRRASLLCSRLIGDGTGSWQDESDVVDAMARGLTEHDPSRLAPDDVEPLVQAFIAEGEGARGSRARLDLQIEFSLPFLTGHPLFTPDLIVRALEARGLARRQIEEHLAAVHPERRPYRGAWRLSLRDRLREAGAGPVSRPGETRVVLDDDRVGHRSHLTVVLEHDPDFAGYFLLSVSGARDGCFSAAAPTYSEVSP